MVPELSSLLLRKLLPPPLLNYTTASHRSTRLSSYGSDRRKVWRQGCIARSVPLLRLPWLWDKTLQLRTFDALSSNHLKRAEEMRKEELQHRLRIRRQALRRVPMSNISFLLRHAQLWLTLSPMRPFWRLPSGDVQTSSVWRIRRRASIHLPLSCVWCSWLGAGPAAEANLEQRG